MILSLITFHTKTNPIAKTGQVTLKAKWDLIHKANLRQNKMKVHPQSSTSEILEQGKLDRKNI